MLGRRKRKMDNTATTTMPMGPRPPTPERVVYTQPSRPYVGIIFTLFVCIVALGPIAWIFGVFVLGQAGFKKPERAMAELLLLVTVALPLLAYVTWLVSGILNKVLSYKERMKMMDLEAMRYTNFTAGSPALPNGRLTGEQKRLFENLALVMEQAYRDYADSGEMGYSGNTQRPWSKRSVLSMDPPRYGRMPDSKATDIRKWLVEHGVLIGEPGFDQINTDLFLAWSDFRALLEEEFNLPVVVQTQKALPSPTNQGYVPIDI